MPRELTIAGRLIDDNQSAYLIAELGSNGRRDTELTKRMMLGAKQAGASAAKLQRRDNQSLYVKSMLESPYAGPNSFGANYGEHRAALEYSDDQFRELKDYAAEIGIHLGVTAFDVPSADALARLDVDFLKIASACITDTVLLKHCAKLGLPMVVSTGTGTQHDVDLAVETITKQHCPFALLQCTASYPLLDPALLNLRVIETFRQRYPSVVTGLSSHFPLGWDAVLAYALGGRVFEKHFTLDRTMRGADHKFSLTPPMLRSLVDRLEQARVALGTGRKDRLPGEAEAVRKMGKSCYAARDLPAGHILTRSSIAIKSPGGGIPPSRLVEMLGRKLPAPLAEDAALPELKWYE